MPLWIPFLRHNQANVYVSIEHNAGPLAIHSPFLMPDHLCPGGGEKATDLSGSSASIHPGPENIVCFKLVPTDGPTPCPSEVRTLATHMHTNTKTHSQTNTQLSGSFQSGRIVADSMTKRNRMRKSSLCRLVADSMTKRNRMRKSSLCRLHLLPGRRYADM